jgi:transposase
MRASARLSVRELSQSDLYLYDRVLPKKSLLLDCLKVIDWEQFDQELAAYYSGSREGQPPYPATILLKLEFLCYLYGIGRRTVIERATSDLHWKYFLRLPIDAALPDHSTLSYFRRRLGAKGFKEIFDALIRQAREHGLVSDRLRLKDATHIDADIAVPTALGLFAQLRQRMLAAVEALDPGAAESFEVALELMRERSQGEDDPTRLQTRVDLVQDILAWMTEQSEPADPTKANAWQKLQTARQLAEKILSDLAHPEAGDKTLSVVDPDARRGKHGEYYDGYLLDIMMDAESELITSLEVLPANGDEARDAIDLIEAEEKAHNNEIEQLSMDGIGFNGEVLRTLTDRDGLDVEVFTPPRDFTTGDGFDPTQFELIDNGERLRCPAGEVSGKAGRKADKPNTQFYAFAHRTCASCPMLAACCPNFNPAGRTGRRVSKNEYEREYAAARKLAQTERYAAVRRRHPAIERKLNEIVRHHRSRRAIYRGLGRVKIQQLMTSFAINIKRIVKLMRLQYEPAA